MQVVPVVSLNRAPNQTNGRQLGVPPTWPVPDSQQRQTGGDPRLTGYTVDESLGNGGYTSAVTIVGGRRRLSSSPGSRGLVVPQARRGARGLLADEGAPTPAMAPMMRKAPVKPGEAHSESGPMHGANWPGFTLSQTPAFSQVELAGNAPVAQCCRLRDGATSGDMQASSGHMWLKAE